MWLHNLGKRYHELIDLARQNENLVTTARKIGVPDFIEPLRRYFYKAHMIDKCVGPYEFKMWIDNPLSEAWYETDGIYDITNFFYEKLLSEGDLVVDVGAHNGFYSLLSAACVGKSGRIVAFEALPSNFSTIVRNIALNNIENIQAFNLAVGAQRDRVRFNKYNDGMISNSGKLKVEMIALADMFDEPIDVLKIDVEGAEYDVVQGALALMSDQTRIMCEIHPDRMKHFGKSPKDLMNLLGTLDSTIYFWTNGFDSICEYRGQPIESKSFAFVFPDECSVDV